MKKPINEIARMQRIAGIITENENPQDLLNSLSTITKASDDSKLYNTVTSIVETLRDKNIDDKDIEEFILMTVKQIISEV
jgi:hypothetical protein